MKNGNNIVIEMDRCQLLIFAIASHHIDCKNHLLYLSIIDVPFLAQLNYLLRIKLTSCISGDNY